MGYFINMNKYMKIGIIGLGFVGSAMYKSFIEKTLNKKDYEIIGYDKYKESPNSFNDCLSCDVLFTVLPTLYDDTEKSYDNSPTFSVLEEINNNKYNNVIVIKSTVEPKFTENISKIYPNINFIHNPEFLTAKTAYIDFHNQTHIVLGKTTSCDSDKYKLVYNFYTKLYPNAHISECNSTESETMKIACNSFYAVKIQYFNEIYKLAECLGEDYNKILELMLKNNWINPMHTQVPGSDGKLSYGGMCFPKDTSALCSFMETNDVPCEVLKACISERNKMRLV